MFIPPSRTTLPLLLSFAILLGIAQLREPEFAIKYAYSQLHTLVTTNLGGLFSKKLKATAHYDRNPRMVTESPSDKVWECSGVFTTSPPPKSLCIQVNSEIVVDSAGQRYLHRDALSTGQ